MAELTQEERLQPSLLDRLTDTEPDKEVESADKRVLSIDRLREAVKRDLAWLLNTPNLETTDNLDDYPEVQSSVLNYGIPELAGNTASSADATAIERAVKQAIINCEPRILKNTLRVRTYVAEDQMNHNALTFEIQGELWASPVPLSIVLQSQVDLETGSVLIEEGERRGQD